jgi:hypothetical protein
VRFELRSIGLNAKAVKMASRERNRDRMRHLLVLPTALTRCLAALCCVLSMVTSGAALAQTTGTANPSSDPAQPSVKEDVPPGGCMPIGLTASGEIVFPFQCKEFIERERGKAVEQKPAAAEEKATAAPSEGVATVEQKPAAVEEKAAAAPSEGVAAVEQKPAAAEEKAAAAPSEGVAAVEQKPAAAEEKAAAAPSEGVAPENGKPAKNSVETAVLPKRVRGEPRKRAMSQNGCQHYRTYDPASGTYRGYDRRTHSC